MSTHHPVFHCSVQWKAWCFEHSGQYYLCGESEKVLRIAGDATPCMQQASLQLYAPSFLAMPQPHINVPYCALLALCYAVLCCAVLCSSWWASGSPTHPRAGRKRRRGQQARRA